VITFFKALPPCVIGMEACATAHYWARELGQTTTKGYRRLSHQLGPRPAQAVLGRRCIWKPKTIEGGEWKRTWSVCHCFQRRRRHSPATLCFAFNRLGHQHVTADAGGAAMTGRQVLHVLASPGARPAVAAAATPKEPH
jgi:hypothetical protein